MNVLDLAIVALELRLPGAESLSELSDFIHSDRSTIALSPASRYIGASTQTQNSRWGSFLPDVFAFDHQAFNLTEEESLFLDPQQRIMLEIAGKALDQAGLSTHLNRANVGVFIGGRMNSYGFDYSRDQCQNKNKPTCPRAPAAPLWGRSQNFLAAWIADRFDLAGPAMVVDAACSSSLSALWVAAQAIANKSCEMALVGGVDLLIDSLTFDLLEEAGALSSTGYCRPLDQRADGYLPGEGAIALVLKPISTAQKDGDVILAHLRQIRANNDGATMGVTTPNVAAQQELIKQVYTAGDGYHLEYVELHGTGTAIGDPIEVDALNRGLLAANVPAHRIDIGSIKQQAGHLHSASGLAGLAKITAIVQTQLIPATSVSKPNPRLDLDKTYFKLATQARKLIYNDASLAVSSFGFGGTNVHAVIRMPADPKLPNIDNLPLVLPLSAPSLAQLRDLTAQWVEQLMTAQPIDAARMCVAAGRRKSWNYRLAVTAHCPQKIASLLTKRLFSTKLSSLAQPQLIHLNPTHDGATIRCIAYLMELDSNVKMLVDELSELTGMSLNQLTNDLRSFAELCLQAKTLTSVGFPISYLRFPIGCAAIGDFVTGNISLMDALSAVALFNYTENEASTMSQDFCVDMASILSTAQSTNDIRSGLAESLCSAYEAGVNVNWRSFYGNALSSLPIPHYPPDGSTFNLPERSRRNVDGIDIKVVSQKPDLIIEATMHAHSDLIAQHLVYGVNVLPGVAWFGVVQDMLAEAGRHYDALEDVRFLAPLTPMPATKIICRLDAFERVTVSNASSGQQYFSASMISNTGSIPESINVHDKITDTSVICSGTSTYRWLRSHGYTHGRYYRNISFIVSAGANQTIARLESSRYGAKLHALNPGLLDAMTISAIDPVRILDSKSPETTVVPFSIGSVQFYRPLTDTVFVHTTVSSHNTQGYRATQTLLSENGNPVAVFTNLTSKTITFEKLKQAIFKNTFCDKTTHSENVSDGDLPPENINELDITNHVKKEENFNTSTSVPPSASEHSVLTKVSDRNTEHLLWFLRQANLSVEDADLEFLETGFDSIALVELSDRLASEYALPLYPTIFFEFPTPRVFVEGFLKNQGVDLLQKSVEENPVQNFPIVNQANIASETTEKKHVQNFSSTAQTDIAIIGLSLCLPGANNDAEYWQLLSRKEVKATSLPKTRRGWEDKMRVVAIGAYLNDVDMFDPSIFRISPREAPSIDPQARILYERVWEALEGAGIQPIGENTGKTGLWVAYSHDHYYEERLRCDVKEGRGLGLAAMVANRLSFALNWHGPSQMINTLCSSSLVAIHEAVHALRRKEVDLAVVGAVNLAISPNYYTSMQAMGVISASGRCRSFDSLADGTLPGEGAVCIVLRRHNETAARGESTLAIIKGTSIGHGGLSTRYSAPNPNAQAAVVSAALHDAGVSADTIGLIEAHGTGTILGDPIEIEGLKKVWLGSSNRRQICGLGSVKSNIGHLESAAGLAGLVKVILAMQEKVLPPTAGVTRPNDHIAFEDSPFFLIDRSTPWPANRPLAGVSAFGMGGVNSHVVLAPAPAELPVQRLGLPPEAFVCKVSAATELALRRLAGLYAEALGDLSAWQVADFCFTANTARAELKYSVATGGSLEQIITSLKSIQCGEVHVPIRPLKNLVPHHPTPDSLSQMKPKTAVILADQYNQGHQINWQHLYEGAKNRLIPIPTYPFNKQSYWLPELTKA